VPPSYQQGTIWHSDSEYHYSEYQYCAARLAHLRSKGGFARRTAYESGVTDAWVYMLRCADGSLYTGWSNDVQRRLARHLEGTASRYTASRLPVELALALPMPDRTTAMREEARIKALDRDAKLALIASSKAPAS
jgi:putative endonuclease